MRRWLLALVLLATFGCASNPAVPRAVQLRKDVLTAIDALEVLARSVEAGVNAKLLTNNQANDVWDIEKAAINILRITNQNAYAVLAQALVEIEKLPVAEKVRPYISVARITLAALSPPITASRTSQSSYWPPCQFVGSRETGCRMPMFALKGAF